jgi:hypothetical protein
MIFFIPLRTLLSTLRGDEEQMNNYPICKNFTRIEAPVLSPNLKNEFNHSPKSALHQKIQFGKTRSL